VWGTLWHLRRVLESLRGTGRKIFKVIFPLFGKN
jgi:hypothetical protein